MSTVLIIGASGFLGRYLTTCCPGARIIGTYHLNSSTGLEFLDLRESWQIQSIMDRIKPSIVIYAAGLTDVDACERTPSLAWRLNTHAVAEVASFSYARTVYISTDYVFEGSRGMYCEEDEPAPVSVYGRSRLEGERAVLARRPGNLVVRVSGLYDTHGVKGQDYLTFPWPTPLDDTRISCPVHVFDVVSAIQRLLESSNGGVYHVAGPDVLSRYEFWQLVALRFAASSPTPRITTNGAPRPRDSSLSTQLIQSLGWRARPVCQGLPPLKPSLTVETKEVSGALLLDCVGGLLTNRTWLPKDSKLAAIDRMCAIAKNGQDSWQAVAHSLGLDEVDIPNLHEQVTFRYAPNPPVWACLREWRANYRLALLNNGPAETFHCWVRKYGLDQVFDLLANSEEMGVRKPAPEFFLRVAKQLDVPVENCILIDDEAQNIDSARRCGLHGIQTSELRKHPLSVHMWDEHQARKLLPRIDQNGWRSRR